MKTIVMSVLCAALGCSVATASIGVETGVSSVTVSGVRLHGARGAVTSYDRSLATFFAALSYSVGDNWRVALTRTRFSNLRFSAVSPDSDIFGDAESSAPVLTPYSGTESMDLTGLEVSYSWPLVKDTVVSIAPTLEFVDAKARIASRRFSDTEVRPGARAVVRYYLRDHLNLALGYRYSSATGRDFHQIQATVGFEFR